MLFSIYVGMPVRISEDALVDGEDGWLIGQEGEVMEFHPDGSVMVGVQGVIAYLTESDLEHILVKGYLSDA